MSLQTESGLPDTVTPALDIPTRERRAATATMNTVSLSQRAQTNAGDVTTMNDIPAAHDASGAADMINTPTIRSARRRTKNGTRADDVDHRFDGADGGNSVMPLHTQTVRELPPNIAAIVELQKQRVFCIKTIGRLDRSVEAFIARYVGYTSDLDDKTRKDLFLKAQKFRRAIEKSGQSQTVNQGQNAASASIHIEGVDHSVIDACAPIVLHSFNSRQSWDVHRDHVEKRMRQLAESLPVARWVKSVRGFGMLGLAIVVGEAGDIANYATKERLWKRLGLAVIDGERQQRRTGVDEAAKHGYNPRRRAEFWTICDSMFRHQWNGEKDDRPAGPAGPYGEVYAARKAYTSESRLWTGARRENDARRIMGKALIADLHAEWHRAVNSVELMAAE